MSEVAVVSAPGIRPTTARRWELALFLLLLLAGAAIRIADLGGVVVRSPDERTYTREASIVADQGTRGFRVLVGAWQADPSLFAYPPPTRVGYLWLLSRAMLLTGRRDAGLVAVFSCVAGIGTLLLVGVIGWRFCGPRTAWLAMIFYGSSPIALMFARRAWEESFAELFAALLLLIALEAVRSRSWWWSVAAGVLAPASFMVKELAVLDAALVTVLLGAALALERRWKPLAALGGSAAFSTACCCAWIAHLLGNFATYLRFERINVQVAQSMPYSVANSTGTPLTWVHWLAVCDPVAMPLAALGLLGVAWSLLRRKPDPGPRLWLSAIVLLTLVVPAIEPHSENLRFTATALAPLCILAAFPVLALIQVLNRLPRAEARWASRLTVAALLCAACINYVGFRENFVRTDLQDLSVGLLQINAERR